MDIYIQRAERTWQRVPNELWFWPDYPFFKIKIPGTQTVAGTADKSQVPLQSSQAANGNRIIVVKEGILCPYFSPQQCLDLHILDVSEV